MNRRNFLKTVGAASAAGMLTPQPVGAEGLGMNLKTKHVIVILNGNGCRKKEFYESPDISPNITGLAKEAFVYTEDANNTVSNHGNSWTELLTGNELQSGIPLYPTMPHYIRKHLGDSATNYWFLQGISYYRGWRYNVKYYTSHPQYGIETRPVTMTSGQIFFERQERHPRQIVAEEFPDDMGLTVAERTKLEQFVGDTLATGDYVPNLEHRALRRTPFWEEAQALYLLPKIFKEFKPRVMVFQQVGHDTGHGAGGLLRDETGFFEYAQVARSTDEAIGELVRFVKNDPYFSKNTAIIIRPEFGRDDEINLYGEIHHSEGYYYCYRSASIWAGPDFKPGVTDLVVNRLDFAPTVAALFNAPAPYSGGQIREELWASHVGYKGKYRPYTPA
jgi:hypothetical protein